MPLGPREKSKPMDFPVFGVDISTAAFDQRPQTTALGLNVRGFDAGTDRKRGGSRAGLTPFIGGAGSVIQVAGFNVIQSLSCIVTADINATFNPTPPPPVIQLVEASMVYEEIFMGTPYIASPGLTFESWTISSPITFDAPSNQVIYPSRLGLGVGTAEFTLSTDGTDVTLVATLLSMGFTFTGLTPGTTITQSMPNADFFPPSSVPFTGTWQATKDVDGTIMILSFSLGSA